MELPDRPRLSRRVAARRHLADGQVFVVLVDQRSGRSVRIGEREWAVVGAMDGTRGADGLVVAAARRGTTTSAARVSELVGELAAAGLLDDDPVDAPAERAPPTPPDRALDPLLDHTFDCDGAGGCCRTYPTIVFLPLDVVRARAALPMVQGGGDDEASAFTPASGAIDAVSTPAMRDGRCIYLEDGGRCGVHAALGAGAKPFGCRTYPLTFVDDGTSVRVAPRPECACVPRSAIAREGYPLVAEGVRRRSDLPEPTYVHRVAERVLLGTAGGLAAWAPRDELARWSRAIAEAATPDAAAAFAALAATVPGGLDPERDSALVRAPPALEPTRVAARIAALGEAAGRKAAEGWRSPRDLSQQAFVALETACELAARAPTTFASGPRHERERAAEAVHLRALVFGHLLVLDDPPLALADALTERAARVVVARALGVVAELAELPDPAFAWPLSLVEGLVRGHAL